jgi:glutathione S-transferase
MVMLARQDIRTLEVLDWQGVHLLHFAGSTCSQKVRIALGLKGVDWTSHPVNLVKRENYSDWFMGINPRGLVPVLVHDGQVIIESNDILAYLDAHWPEPALMPGDQAETLQALLDLEDELHEDMRNLTMRFMTPTALMKRSREQLEQFQAGGSGTVGGQADPKKAAELAYWQAFEENNGITDEQVRESARRIDAALADLEQRLSGGAYLLGEALTLADVAWFITVNRVGLAGFPVAGRHPRVGAWFAGLMSRPLFRDETRPQLPIKLASALIGARDALFRRRLQDVAGL